MVKNEILFRSDHGDRIFIDPTTDGKGTVAVITGPLRDDLSWPHEIMVLYDNKNIEMIRFKEELRSMTYEPDGLLWIGTSIGVGTRSEKRPYRMLPFKLPGGELVSLDHSRVALISGGISVYFIERKGEDFKIEHRRFKNPTRQPTHYPKACFVPDKGLAFSLEHGLIQFENGDELNVPGVIRHIPTAGLWYVNGILYSLSETFHNNSQEIAALPYPASGKSVWLYQFSQRIRSARPSMSLGCFLFSYEESNHILRGLDMKAIGECLHVEPGVGEIRAMVDAGIKLYCFGTEGVSRLSLR